METVKDLLKESFEIPDDETLKVSRNLELIFLQNNRREIPVPKDETKEEEEEIDAKEIKTEDGGVQETDGDNADEGQQDGEGGNDEEIDAKEIKTEDGGVQETDG